MITKDTFDTLLDRTAIAALMYTPELATGEGVVSLSEHVAFVLEELDVPDEHAARIRDLVTATIVDPTSHRFVLYAHLVELVDDEE
ncbi:hypothetical protein [Microbacterium karelineae]|uniref:hypothetical protein n=1 Tax=Microbacterium karelineae TaxID=2654283 RepID=UPI0012EA90BB|nr:hypothetical protein [Microbacterium karelineae]